MRVIDVLTSPWAIMPDKLLEIRAVYDAHTDGKTIDLASIEARLGKPLQNAEQGYTVRSGVAVIPVNGVIGKRMNMFSDISGGASTELIARDINAALEDQSVQSILLHIDSPGGSVDGVENLADIIRAAAQIKPIVSFADGTMASAAYWLGSAADAIVASSSTAQIGSIGVVATHRDVSRAQEMAGIKTTEISAGRYKRIASQYGPLTESGQAEIQRQIDGIYTIFVDDVARNRGVSAEKVLADMADGRVFLARDAQARGMVDYIASLDATISNMANGIWPTNSQNRSNDDMTTGSTPNKPATGGQPQPATVAATEITIEMLNEKHPQIVTQLMQIGADAERERIQSCEDAALPGHEKIVNAMKFDGKSTGADVALAIVQEEKSLRVQHLKDFHANAPQPLPHAAINPVAQEEQRTDAALPLDERAKKSWDSDAQVRKEFGTYGAYLAYMRVAEKSTGTHG